MSSASRSVAGLSPDKLQQLIDRLQVRHPPGAAGRIPRQQRDGSPLPLSFGQERIWLLHHYEPESAAYNLPLVFELRGTLSRPRLAAALSEVVRRHESLRTIFAERAGELSQHIQPAAAVELPLVDLDSLPQDRRAAAAERLAERHVLTPFDLSRGPLLTAALVRSGPQAHRFMLTVHHIAADGWSMVVLVRELAQIYHAAGAGLPPPLPELPIQYADFALWQRRELAGFEQQDLPFWLEQLAGDPPVLGLPTDRPRTAVQTYRGGQLARAFGPELTGDLRALSSRRRATLLMTLHAGLAVVLQRWSGQEDLLLGTPVAGRRRVETEGLIGFFLNTLVLRLDLSGEPTFDELLERARAVALDALSHQDLPFEAVLARLRPERTAWGTPLFQVLLNVLNFPRSEIELPELTIDLMATPAMPAKFDLTLYVHQDDAGLACDLVYNADLFAAGRIEELFEQWRILLAQAVEQPAKRISELSLITPAALALLPASGEELLPVWKGAIHARFAEWVQHQPQRLAVEDAFGAWTYGDLAAASRAVRAALEQAGIGAEQPVAIYAHRSAALLAAVLGILQAGAAFMILDPAYPPPQLLDRLTAVPPRAWIQLEAAGPPPAEVARFLALHPPAVVVHLAPALPSSSPAGDEISGDVTTADCLAYIAFTSGSTGEPKAICGTQRPLSHFLAWHAGQF
ncbi:MAG TPA: condensation domain-containing protein, partial [Thermoanaerobaculia bacterium]|nr:condensation domain-containing protein [Thermoanaerobaculia bacterium]